MNKVELVADVAERSGLTKSDARKAVDAMMDSIKAALASGDSVSLVGFGTFDVGHRAARAGRNPQTGESMNIPARNYAKFGASSDWKRILNA